MMARVALILAVPLVAAMSTESAVEVDGHGHIAGHNRGHRHQKKHAEKKQKRTKVDQLRYHGVAPPAFRPVRKDGKEIVINEWACGLMCESHAKEGCCSYKHNGHLQADEVHANDYDDDTGLCEFREGTITNDTTQDMWDSGKCQSGFSSSKCFGWGKGRCDGPSQPGSLGLPIWELAWSEEFDQYSCVSDKNGVLRPNPHQWSHEIGYKRGRELQWYQPDNVKCEDGKLVITAKRQNPRPAPDAKGQCKVNNDPTNKLSDELCEQCAPPHFEYFYPCDTLQSDRSGNPACDCSSTAQYTSGSIMTRGKVEFSYGLIEMRAKIDTRPGAWSSFWAIGDFDLVPWPRNGEIDILDAFQRMLKSSIVHADETGRPDGAVQHAAARAIDPQWEKYYHTWQLEWDEKFVIIRVDGEEMFRVDLSVADPQRTTWPNPFTNKKNFFLILNLAIGGHSGGDADESEFPVEFKVDYIRYWKKKGHTYR
eukprot:gb/GFBE01073729.1/.p1 GENE.gb/GFBE01073729.1/~~gb/GFBE01073729.1/.p1  ORF type:complete len:480 (+),score=85.88 gb/GFBE01073729.1/:1-1440(+)